MYKRQLLILSIDNIRLLIDDSRLLIDNSRLLMDNCRLLIDDSRGAHNENGSFAKTRRSAFALHHSPTPVAEKVSY